MQYRRVVVGVDFSASSLAAARWAARHFAPDAEILLVHALRDAEAPTWLRDRTAGLLALQEDVTPSLRGGLRGLADLIDPARVQAIVTHGAPADALVAAAIEHGADLICVGQTRTRRGSARFGATTAQRVLTRTTLPLVVVAGTGTESIDRVLVAVDETASTRVAAEAARAALRSEARLHALHVLNPDLMTCLRALHPADGGGRGERDAAAAARDEEKRAILLTHRWLERVLDASDTHTTRATTHVRSGDPGQEIVATAHAAGADLIVMGRVAGGIATPEPRQRAASARLPIGSTTRFVTWAAPCPILVLQDRMVDVAPTPTDARLARRMPGRRSLPTGTLPLRPDPLPPAATIAAPPSAA